MREEDRAQAMTMAQAGGADPADPVLRLVRRLNGTHPAVPSRVIIGDVRVSDNPRPNNCARGWEAARYDSKVLMPRDYMSSIGEA